VTTATFTATGMTCQHCVSSVKAEVSKINAVTSVEVELSSGQVTVNSSTPLSDKDVLDAIAEAGYAAQVSSR
jgi:copper chaperone